MTDKEQKIKEQRTSEAIVKGYMGLSGKFACIATFLGSKIISETADFYSESEMVDVWDLGTTNPYEDGYLPTVDEYGFTREIGHIFDGLSRGMHLEIKYLNDERSLTVNYKGYPVYREVSGDLECFAPGEWCEMIEKLFVVAKKLANEKKAQDAIEERAEVKSLIEKRIDSIKKKWGF